MASTATAATAHQRGAGQKASPLQQPYSPSGGATTSHLQSKRPPKIQIGSSNTADMAAAAASSHQPSPPAPSQHAPVTEVSVVVAPPKAIQRALNNGGDTTSHHLLDNLRSSTPPPSLAKGQPVHRAVLSSGSLGSEESAPSTSDGSLPPPPVVVHSATRTVPFFDFDVSHHTAPPPLSSVTSSGLVKRGGDAAGESTGGTAVIYIGASPVDTTNYNLNGSRTAQQQQQRDHNNSHHATDMSDHDGEGAGEKEKDCDSNGKNIPRKVLLRNLTLFVVLKVLGSFDSGAFSATLSGENGITDDWGLSVAQQGTLSSSVFLGNMIGCAIAGHLFTIYSAKLLLLVSLVIHGFFTFLFASADSYEFALLCRFFIGTTLAFIVVYTPVWVDEFSPRSSAATWMALQNAGVPIGIMLGFVIGGLMPTYTSVSWEWSFYFKAIVMVPIVAIVAKTERHTLDSGNQAAANAEFQQQVRKKMDQSEQRAATAAGESPANSAASGETVEIHNASGGGASSPRSPAVEAVMTAVGESWRRFHYIGSRLLRNSVYIANMLSLSSLYFVVSGLQTFVTSYLREDPFNASMETIVIGFGCAVVTAPVFGVVAGGVLLDKIGGYHGNLVRASRFALMWGVLAACFAVVCIFLRTTLSFLLVVWVLLFCGGAIIPPGSGINMASLPQHLRPSGSSVAQMSFNFLGNFSGPLLCGWIGEWTGNLTWGIRAVLCMGVVGVIPMSLSAYFATRRAERQALIDNALAQAALRRQNPGDDDDDGVHSDSSAEFGIGGRHAVDGSNDHHRAGDHHYHHCYASNMSVIGALEEVVEAKHDDASSGRRESPRHADSDIELMELVAPGSSRQVVAARQSTSSDRASPGSFRGQPSTTNVPAHNNSHLFADTTDALGGSGHGGRGTPQRTPHLKSGGGSFRVATPHSTRNTSGAPFSPFAASQPAQRGRSSSVNNRSSHQPTPTGLIQILHAGDEDDDGDVDGIARGMCGVYAGARRPTLPGGSGGASLRDDDDHERSVVLDSAQFNLSFPYQHTFGMDVVRGILGMESPARGADPKQHTTRTTPPPVSTSRTSPQMRPHVDSPQPLTDFESPPLPDVSRKSSRQASGEYST